MSSGKYDDILYHSYPYPTDRKRLSASSRAAQFSPFAALTGFEAMTEETARLTEEERELSEDMKSLLYEKLQRLSLLLPEKPKVRITYFVPDARKNGGSYRQTEGIVLRLDDYKRVVLMRGEAPIPYDRIYEIDGECFSAFDT